MYVGMRNSWLRNTEIKKRGAQLNPFLLHTTSSYESQIKRNKSPPATALLPFADVQICALVVVHEFLFMQLKQKGKKWYFLIPVKPAFSGQALCFSP